MLAQINGVDLTPYINPKTYEMNTEKQYESWQDGNFVEHRIYIREKVKGSFDVALYGQNNMTTQNFLETWMGGVDNNIALINVFVQSRNRMEPINAYFDFSGTFHREMINGNYCDVMHVEILER